MNSGLLGEVSDSFNGGRRNCFHVSPLFGPLCVNCSRSGNIICGFGVGKRCTFGSGVRLSTKVGNNCDFHRRHFCCEVPIEFGCGAHRRNCLRLRVNGNGHVGAGGLTHRTLKCVSPGSDVKKFSPSRVPSLLVKGSAFARFGSGCVQLAGR